ncbi:MAG TPA: hypothetical protein VFW16_09585 [Streptosporangiaceae bacterium]|nr:hypothetical protein [Streptosporangiaceae bacterium]
MAQPFEPPPSWPGEDRTHQTGPVFADPSGQRRRLMRVIGAAASMALVGALVLAGVGLFGGPDTPFSVFGAPAKPTHGPGAAGPRGSGGRAPGSASGVPGAPSAPARSGKPSPSPSTSQDHSPTPTPTSSPTPTNKAGRTPPGQGRSKRPRPSPSSHGT